MRFNRSDYLEDHTQLEHPNAKKVLCNWDDCNWKPFSTTMERDLHVGQWHSGTKPFWCPSHGCSELFLRSDLLYDHLLIQDSGYCGHKRPAPEGVENKKVEDHYSGLECRLDECNRVGVVNAFGTIAEKESHMMRDHGRGPRYKCKWDECNEPAFSTPEQLCEHLENVHSVQRH